MGDYWVKQFFSSIAFLFKMGTSLKFESGGKMLEKMVRIEYAIELMNDDVEGNLMTMRKEFDAMKGEFDVMKQHMNEAEEDNRKTIKEEFDALRGEFDVMKQHMNEAEEDNRKTMKEEFDAMRGEFDVMKQHMNEAEEDNRKTMKEEFDAVRGEFEVMKRHMNEAEEDNRKTMKEEFDAVRGEFDVMKRHINETEENNRKAIKEGFDAVRGEFEVKKLTMKEAPEYLKQKKDGRHAFRVLRSKNITSNGYGFLVLEVRVPADGFSRNSNWCFDYQYLCEDFHRRPTGCGQAFRESGGFRDCRRNYNSDMDIGNTLSCNPAKAIVKLAATAFPNQISQMRSPNSFGFYVCSSEGCSENFANSSYALARIRHFNRHELTYYTVCR